MLDQLKQLAIQNNTAGGSLYDLAQMINSQSPAEIISKLREAEDKRNQMVQSEQQQQMQLMQEQERIQSEREDKQLEHDDYWREKEIQRDILVAEIRALGFPNANDMNSDQIPDVLEVEKFLHQQGIDSRSQLLEEQKLNSKQQESSQKAKEHSDNIALEEKKLKSREKIEKMKLRNPVAGERKKK
jgi:hypothetical protein